MKEFIAENGGRYTYVDDIINLQDLSLSMTHLFDGCGDFIISGCEVSGESIGGGYVFINGKIRNLKSQRVNSFPFYIHAADSTEDVGYVDFGDKPGVKVYGCGIQYTGSTHSIMVEKGGKAKHLADAFFGKYAVLLDGLNDKPVKNDTTFEKKVKAHDLEAQQFMLAKDEKNHIKTFYDEAGNFVVEYTFADKINKLTYLTTGDFQFACGENLIYTVKGDSIIAKVKAEFPQIKCGSISMKENHIYDEDTIDDNGTIEINMLGHGKDYFRNFRIGDGKGNSILFIDGKNKAMTFAGKTIIECSQSQPLSFKHIHLDPSENMLTCSVVWLDKNDAKIAELGYSVQGSKDFYIQNLLEGIRLKSKNIYLDGTVFVGETSLSDLLYGKTNLDTRFDNCIKKTDSIKIFVDAEGEGEVGQKKVCEILGASHISSLTTLKTDIEGKVNPYINDTGWVDFTGQGVTGEARQIGFIVTVCGIAEGPGTGDGECLFVLPENINAPRQTIHQICGKSGEFVSLMNDKRAVAKIGAQFSVTYIVSKELSSGAHWDPNF